jgi:hypothetical protein
MYDLIIDLHTLIDSPISFREVKQKITSYKYSLKKLIGFFGMKGDAYELFTAAEFHFNILELQKQLENKYNQSP